MIRLHGFATSNYHNVVKAALLEKGVDFEEVLAYPPAPADFLAKNPTGKYPCLETESGEFIGESKVILNYIEDAYPQVPLLPADPVERAKIRELMEIMDLHLELPARRLYAEVFFGGQVDAATKEAVRPDLERGLKGLAARASFAPYIAGSELTLADFGAAAHLPLVAAALGKIYGEDLAALLPGYERHVAAMGAREIWKRVEAEREADMPKFFAHYQAAMAAAAG